METRNNNLLLHDLTYIGEHLTCNHYMADVGTGFIYEELPQGASLTQSPVQHNHLLIFLEGECTLSCNQFLDRKFSGNQMILIPRMADFKGCVERELKMLDMAFDAPMSGCDKLVLQAYHPLCMQINYDFRAIEVRYPLTAFVDLLVYCLKNGMSCAHLHEMKHKELFFYLRGFYKKEEVAELFYAIIGRSFDFRSFVLENYRKTNSLQELIALSNMSARSFMRKFKDEFGITAHRWLAQQTCSQIIHALAEPEVSLKKIMDDFGFESSSNFNRFCRLYFQCTPSELVKRHRTGCMTI